MITTKKCFRAVGVVGLLLLALSGVLGIDPEYANRRDTSELTLAQRTQREEELAKFSEFLRAKASEVRGEAQAIHLPDIEYEFGDKDGAFVFGYTAYEADNEGGKEKYEHLKFEWHPHHHVHREGKQSAYIHGEPLSRVPVTEDTLIPPRRYRVIRDGEEQYVYTPRTGPVGRALEHPGATAKGWGQALRDAGSWITSWLQTSTARVEERAANRLHQGAEHLKEKAGDVRDAVKGAAQSVRRGARNVAEGVADTAHDIYDATRNRIHRTTEGAKHIAEEVASGARYCAGKIVNGVCQTVNYVEDKACAAGECLKEGARSVTHGIRNAEEAVKEGVRDSVHWVGDKASAAGHRVVDTIVDTKDAIKDTAKGIRCAVGDKLCPHGRENAEQIENLRERVDTLEHSSERTELRRGRPDIEIEVGSPGQRLHVDEQVRLHGDHMHIDTRVDLPKRF